MHRARVIGQQQRAFAQFVDKLIECGLANAIYAGVAQRLANLLTDYRVAFCAEQNPLHWRLRGDCGGGLGKSFRQPTFGRSVFRARTESNFCAAKIDMADRFDVLEIAQISPGAEFVGDVKIMKGQMFWGTQSW